MKFKYPKKILIGATVFKITYDTARPQSAEWSFPYKNKPGYIIFGMREHKANPLGFVELVIHEVKEILQAMQSTLISNPTDGSCMFHYSHAEHEVVCAQLAGILSNFIE
jgi:hypothetical protein